jgi:hypothetical protein
LEAAPLRRLAGDIPDDSLIAADLDLGDSVHYYFYRALAAVEAATTDHGGPAFELWLRAGRPRHYEDCRENCQ